MDCSVEEGIRAFIAARRMAVRVGQLTDIDKTIVRQDRLGKKAFEDFKTVLLQPIFHHVVEVFFQWWCDPFWRKT